jgi:hypothetical protein
MDSSKQMPNKVEPFKTPFDVVPKQTLLSNKHLSWTFLLGLAQSLLMMLMANVKFVPFGDTPKSGEFLFPPLFHHKTSIGCQGAN